MGTARTTTTGTHSAITGRMSRKSVAPRSGLSTSTTQGSRATMGSRARTASVNIWPAAARATGHARTPRAARGSSEGHVTPASPSRRSGEPPQYSWAGTEDATREPAWISAQAPTRTPGSTMLRAPMRAWSPTTISPRTNVPASTQWPCRSASAPTLAPWPIRTRPVAEGV